MSKNETSGQESSGTDRQPAHRNELAAVADEQTLKRARWEPLRLAACPGTGRVNVCNLSYGVHEKADHTYTVTVDRGQPTDCTCPAASYQSGPCKHVVAVAADREVLEEAMHGGSDPFGERAPTLRDLVLVETGPLGDGLEVRLWALLLVERRAPLCGVAVAVEVGGARTLRPSPSSAVGTHRTRSFNDAGWQALVDVARGGSATR